MLLGHRRDALNDFSFESEGEGRGEPGPCRHLSLSSDVCSRGRGRRRRLVVRPTACMSREVALVLHKAPCATHWDDHRAGRRYQTPTHVPTGQNLFLARIAGEPRRESTKAYHSRPTADQSRPTEERSDAVMLHGRLHGVWQSPHQACLDCVSGR